ncbi:hypothetical protein AB0912_31435 [Streptomyces sp. NPDC007084]
MTTAEIEQLDIEEELAFLSGLAISDISDQGMVHCSTGACV